MKTVAIIQARMGSTRFPGKVLKQLGSKPVLWWVHRAVAQAKLADKVVIATSLTPADTVIEEFCQTNKIDFVRGSEDDVISRYVFAAEQTKADIVCRITADCPFIDPAVLDAVIALKSSTGAVYASNTWPPSWPDGLDVEVFDLNALMEMDAKVKNQVDRDCVTQWIYRNRSKFPSVTLNCPIPGMQNERWVLDTPNDYLLCCKIAESFKHTVPSYLEIKKFLDSNPELRKLNAGASRNERFYDALAIDQRPAYAFPRSTKAFTRAKETTPLPGQTFSKSYVQYPSGASPLFVSHGDGGYLFDIDGNRYVDLVGGLLPNVLGYCDPDVDFAIRMQLNSGISFSLATELEYEVSERLKKHIPSAEMSKFGKNGADVTAAAVRLARAVTGRNRILLITKGYHGWHDWSIGSTERNIGIPNNVIANNQRIEPDLDKIERTFQRVKNHAKPTQIAAVIIEPEFRTWAFLTKLKQICRKYDAILIFDEIISGFRWDMGGYQKYISVTPDLTCIGKSMGNGMPISAICGPEILMKRFAPPDNIFYSGTFFGEALSLAAAVATIDKMERLNVIKHLHAMGNRLKVGVEGAVRACNLSEVIHIQGEGPRVQFGFNESKQWNANALREIFMKTMIQRGVLVIASNNICFAHNAPEITRASDAYMWAFANVATARESGQSTTVGLERQTVR
jgi:glutamate-1-semialdehyde 2,1-aminomutase/spore coat polysaccharide biosynthesis protein SpsF